MAYVALYRKLRPKNFRSMFGQEHILRALGNQLSSGRVSHAYLFCGTRGTGKTTTAKIFAKAVNCLRPDGPEPCNACESCRAIDSQRSMNVIEIDAASNNGVDNIREIREDVKYPPAEGKYKVYIIDEVHMLSTGAFNALLKTLEEPPSHVIFILATTEPQKIPPTVLSRCQRYDFKRISVADISDALTRYMADEQIEADADAIAYIARISGGAMRDALSVTDQCAGFYFGERITLPKVLELLGAADSGALFKFTDALYSHDTKLLLGLIGELSALGRDMRQFVDDLTVHFRDLLISAAAGGEGLDYPRETLEALSGQSSRLDNETLVWYVNEFSALQNKLRYASNDRLLLEVTCIKLCNPHVEASDDNVNSRLKKLEELFESGLPTAVVDPSPREAAPAAAVYATEPEPLPKPAAGQQVKQPVSDGSELEPIRKGWEAFAAGFGGITKAFLSASKPAYIKNGMLYIQCENESYARALQDKAESIAASLNKTFGTALSLRFITK